VLALPNLVGRRHAALAAVERRLPDAPALVAACRERVQDRGVRLIVALPNLVQNRRAELELCGEKLVGALRVAVSGIHQRGNRTLLRFSDAPLAACLRVARGRLAGISAHLEAVSPLAVLQRGYALVSDVGGRPLTSAGAVRPGARLRLRFADGEVGAMADGGGKEKRQGMLPL